MRHAKSGPTFVAALTIAMVVAMGTAAVATSSFQHTVGTNTHGHITPSGGGTHAWTDHDGGEKHASADVFPGSSPRCVNTDFIRHVHCDTSLPIVGLWGHHWGPDITNHHN